MAMSSTPPDTSGSAFFSPLRYPGGKRKLADFIKATLRRNNVVGGEYAEVYAGGAGVALALLFDDYASRIHINDLDRGIYSFWLCARDQTEALVEAIEAVPITIAERDRQRRVWASSDASTLELALATFFLNRTSRAGIITGGVIGGKDQQGDWKLGDRFNKPDLIRRIRRIGELRDRIEVYNLDALAFLQVLETALPDRSFVYLDPPYYVKGQQLLYANFYQPADHMLVAQAVGRLQRRWMVSYDDTPEIRELYRGYRALFYGISYTAQDKYRGREAAFFSPGLDIPAVPNPVAPDVRKRFRAEERTCGTDLTLFGWARAAAVPAPSKASG